MKELVSVIEKNTREVIHVELTEFNGYDLIGVRVYTENREGVRVPTAKGITCNVEKLPDIIAGLQAAESRAKAAGLLK